MYTALPQSWTWFRSWPVECQRCLHFPVENECGLVGRISELKELLDIDPYSEVTMKKKES